MTDSPTSPLEPAGRAHVEVDLAALERNFVRVAREVAPARVMPVVKADGYGHGAVTVARCLEPLGAAGFLVARPEEGAALRRAGVRAPILVGSPLPAAALEQAAGDDLELAVCSLEQLAALERFAATSGWRPAVHLKIDTGMHRLGVAPAEVPAALERLRGSAAMRWIGLMSHLADADLADSPRNAQQEAAFRQAAARLGASERRRLTLHLANSAGALRLPTARFDLVRPGLALYGGEIAGVALGLEPVLALRGRIRQIQAVAAGEPVGYGGRWRAPRPSRIGVVGVGYADGYPWRAGGAAQALVRGVRVALVGAVSMDLLAIDLSDVSAGEGDEVTLLGRQGGEEIRLAELAAWSVQSPYELLCHLRLRLPRIELRDGVPVADGEPAAVSRRGDEDRA
ncbi:MAG TPA: alanine racemase [Thermoanaerobaculia bacterium]